MGDTCFWNISCSFSSPKLHGQIQSNMSEGVSIFFSEGPHPFPRGDNSENTMTKLKIFSRTTGPISAELGTKHLSMNGTQVFIKMEKHAPFQEEIITEYIDKQNYKNLGEIQNWISTLISTKLGTTHPCVKRNAVSTVNRRPIQLLKRNWWYFFL